MAPGRVALDEWRFVSFNWLLDPYTHGAFAHGVCSLQLGDSTFTVLSLRGSGWVGFYSSVGRWSSCDRLTSQLVLVGFFYFVIFGALMRC